MDIEQTIERARRDLEAGHGKAAARLLTDAAYGTHDAKLERTIRALALRGREEAGFFARGRWDEIVRVAELRGANGDA